MDGWGYVPPALDDLGESFAVPTGGRGDQFRGGTEGLLFKKAEPDVHAIADVLAETQRMLAELRAEMRATVPEPPPARTLRDLSSEWLPRKLKKIPASAAAFDGRVRIHLLPTLGHHTYATLLPEHVEEMLEGFIEEGMGAQTANHVRDAGRQLVSHAIKNKRWVGPNPFEEVSKLKVPEHHYDVPTREEAAAILVAVEARWRPLFAAELYLGPRRKTLFHLKPEDVHLASGTIDFLVTKTGVPIRGIPIPNELRDYLKWALGDAKGEWLFSRDCGRQLSDKSNLLRAVLRRAIERAGVKRDGKPIRLTFRDLRGVSCTLHQEAGCHIWVMAKVLGHSISSLGPDGGLMESMTARRYSKFQKEFVRANLNRLCLRNK
jgi:integrase